MNFRKRKYLIYFHSKKIKTTTTMNTREISNVAKWRRTKRGVVTNIYSKMKTRNEVGFGLEYLHEFSNSKKFDRLFIEWVKSGYLKKYKPSIDRIRRSKGYLVDNIQWLSWGDNRYKQNMERRSRKGQVAQLLNGEVVKIFKSQREVVRQLGIGQGNLSRALHGRRKRTAGFEWKFIFESPELLKQ